MTSVTFTSVKGAPGVTTTACLVGATWPGGRRAMIAECDPAGGDLAARFSLSSMRGWPTFATAVRRAGPNASVVPHLQQLPGGLDILVGTHASGASMPGAVAEQGASARPGAWARPGPPARPAEPAGQGGAAALLSGASHPDHAGFDVLVDAGRLHPITDRPNSWLDCSDVVALVLATDAASVLHVHEHADRLRARCGPRLVLVLVCSGSHRAAEIERFVGIPVAAELPYDPGAAAVATGLARGARRLERSRLTACARELAAVLAARSGTDAVRSGPVGPTDPQVHTDGPVHTDPDAHTDGPPSDGDTTGAMPGKSDRDRRAVIR